MPPDVMTDVWYSTAVSSFVDAGYLPDRIPFRAGDAATRGEFMELVVRALGGVLHALPTQPSFDDVRTDNPSFQYFEEAAVSGWMKGVGNCLGKHPCNANPDSPINRAEAATILLRAFNLEGGTSAPAFPDNPNGQWYTTSIVVAGSHCMLKGDSATGLVRPEQYMNRAEMVVMLKRLDEKLAYPNCDAPQQASSRAKANNVPSSGTPQVCAAADWTCTAWGECASDFPFHSRKCTLSTACHSNALTQGAKPLEMEACTPILISDPSLASMKSLQESDKQMYGKMVSYAQKYDSFTQQLMQPVIEDYADLIDEQAVFIANAGKRKLTAKEKEDFIALGTKRKELLNRFTQILETGKLPPLQQSNTAPTYYAPSTAPSTYDNTQYCEDVKNSLGVSGNWRSSQKVKEAGQKLLDAGCISNSEACSSYQVCN